MTYWRIVKDTADAGTVTTPREVCLFLALVQKRVCFLLFVTVHVTYIRISNVLDDPPSTSLDYTTCTCVPALTITDLLDILTINTQNASEGI